MITREPSDVVIAAGSYHSRLLVACGIRPVQRVKRRQNGEKYPIMEIDRLPVGVVSRIEGPTVSVELVRENEDHLATIFIRWYIVHVDRCVFVD